MKAIGKGRENVLKNMRKDNSVFLSHRGDFNINWLQIECSFCIFNVCMTTKQKMLNSIILLDFYDNKIKTTKILKANFHLG